MLQEECSQNISIKIDDFYKSDSFKNSVNEKIKNKHQSKITHLKSKINEQGSFITDNLTITDQLELEQVIQTLFAKNYGGG